MKQHSPSAALLLAGKQDVFPVILQCLDAGKNRTSCQEGAIEIKDAQDAIGAFSSEDGGYPAFPERGEQWNRDLRLSTKQSANVGD